MLWLARFLLWIATGLYSLSRVAFSVATAVCGFLPLLVSARHLRALTQRYYAVTYTNDRLNESVHDLPALLSWEADVLARHVQRPGRLLVMGCGTGRESLAIAQKGFAVVGIDTHALAVQMAQRRANEMGIRTNFQCADCMMLPYAASVFDHALLSSTMYSVIGGKATRQVWLKEMHRVLKPSGVLIISFARHRGHAPSRLGTLRVRLMTTLAKCPGTNPDYQVGDECGAGHFKHTFQQEDELQAELVDAGACIRELNWAQGVAVVTFRS